MSCAFWREWEVTKPGPQKFWGLAEQPSINFYRGSSRLNGREMRALSSEAF
jgi:hypothetical protein